MKPEPSATFKASDRAPEPAPSDKTPGTALGMAPGSSPGTAPPRLTMMAAIAAAKATVAGITVLQFDSVGRCERCPEGGWTVCLDVIESMARMGDNDLLATYEVNIDAFGEALEVHRTRRYHREDRDQT